MENIASYDEGNGITHSFFGFAMDGQTGPSEYFHQPAASSAADLTATREDIEMEAVSDSDSSDSAAQNDDPYVEH